MQTVGLLKALGLSEASASECFGQIVGNRSFPSWPSKRRNAILESVRSQAPRFYAADPKFKSLLRRSPVWETEGEGEVEGQPLQCADSLYNPSIEILAQLFAFSPSKLPARRDKTQEWIDFLVDIGMRQPVDDEGFLVELRQAVQSRQSAGERAHVRCTLLLKCLHMYGERYSPSTLQAISAASFVPVDAQSCGLFCLAHTRVGAIWSALRRWRAQATRCSFGACCQ
jgi:hypothetical protein